MYSNPALLGLLAAFSIAEIIIAVWALIVFLKAIGEVQGFSAWKALLNSAPAFIFAILIPIVLE